MKKNNQSFVVTDTNKSAKMTDVLSGLLATAGLEVPTPQPKKEFKRRNIRKNLPESEVLRRTCRMTGSDDANSCANICKFAEEAGIRDKRAIEVASGIAHGMEHARDLSMSNRHDEAGKTALSLLYALARCETIANMKVPCRDNRTRKVKEVVSWFGKTHMKIHADIVAALAKESAAKEVVVVPVETQEVAVA